MPKLVGFQYKADFELKPKTFCTIPYMYPTPIYSHRGQIIKYQFELYSYVFWFQDYSSISMRHHLTWLCSNIYEDLHRFAAYEHKIVQKQLQKQFCAQILQICANLHKS